MVDPAVAYIGAIISCWFIEFRNNRLYPIDWNQLGRLPLQWLMRYGRSIIHRDDEDEPSMRDRETWITALCYWVVSLLLLSDFFWRRARLVPWPIVALLAVIAMPVSFALALYGRRTERRRAAEQASLRAENKFEEAAEWQTDGFYFWWTTYWLTEVAVAAFLLIVGIVLAMPLAVLAGLGLGAYPLWCAYQTRIAHKADLEHRRTSKDRITASTDALEDSGWERRPPQT